MENRQFLTTCVTKFQENLLIALVSECPSYFNLATKMIKDDMFSGVYIE